MFHRPVPNLHLDVIAQVSPVHFALIKKMHWWNSHLTLEAEAPPLPPWQVPVRHNPYKGLLLQGVLGTEHKAGVVHDVGFKMCRKIINLFVGLIK